MPDLRATQERFLALVSAVDGPEAAAARLGLGDEDLAALVRADARADAVSRLGVYAEMYLARLEDALADDYRKLAAVLGEDAFHELVLDFLAARPPRHFSLRHLGAPLPAFLREHPLGQARPWLGDLAALEWARVEAYDQPDATALTLTDLQRLPPERFAELPLRAVPACALLEAAAGVDQLWRAREAGAPDPEMPVSGRQQLLVWRQELEVCHRQADATEVPALRLLGEGTTFGSLCERLGEGRAPEEAAALAFQLLGRWASEGLVARPES